MYDILTSIPWYGWVAIVAIVCSALVKIVTNIHRHEERMAMIEKGQDPSRVDDRA